MRNKERRERGGKRVLGRATERLARMKDRNDKNGKRGKDKNRIKWKMAKSITSEADNIKKKNKEINNKRTGHEVI